MAGSFGNFQKLCIPGILVLTAVMLAADAHASGFRVLHAFEGKSDGSTPLSGLLLAGWGLLVGGTSGSGVVLLSLLLAAGLEGTAVIATDSAISIATGVIKIAVFAFAGVLTPTVIVVALLMGLVGFPCTFLAKLIVARMPVHVHTAILDAIVIVGGTVMIYGALV